MPDLSRQERAHGLFTRYPGNPILTSENWPYPTNAVFNPAAAKLNDEPRGLTWKNSWSAPESGAVN